MSALQTLPDLLQRVEASTDEFHELAREIGNDGGIDAAVAYSELWRRIHRNAETTFGGLSEITEFIAFNAQHLVEASRESTSKPEHIETLQGVLPVFKELLRSPLDADALGNLICYLQHTDWPIPMGEDQAYTVMAQLLEQLQDEDLPVEQEDVEVGAEGRPSPVEQPGEESPRDDFRLSLPEDVHPQLVDAFFNEVPQLAEEFTQHIQNLSEGSGGRDDLLRAQRLAHTIKGSSNVTGVPAVATLMHRCEDLLESLYQKHLLPDEDLVQVLMETADCLASQLEFLSGQGPAPDQAEALVETLKNWRVGEPAAPPAPLRPETLQPEAPVQPQAPADSWKPSEAWAQPRPWAELETGPRSDAPIPEVRAETPPAPVAETVAEPEPQADTETGPEPPGAEEPAAAPQEAAAQASPESMRVSAALIEDLLRQAGEVSISTVQLQGLTETLSARMETLMKQQTLMWERLNTIQELVEMRSVATAKGLAVGQGGPEPVFDSLEMDEYNELHSATNFLAESITDAREYTAEVRDEFNRLRGMLKQQDILSRELNESVMGTRMLPFRSIVSRLARVVRQTARSTGKSVKLDITGEEVLVDSAVLNRLTDPLMHMLRNAVDHGIEDAEERRRLGKPEEGSVSVRVERHGDNVSLLIRDDGRGLDYERIRQIGIERRLIQGDPWSLSNPDLARLILLPGFSTRREATQISGRGIGMDVVNTTVLDQRGTLDIRSEPGNGIEVNIRVPMTLISVHTLLVRNSGIALGVPSSSVQQLIFSDLGQWKYEQGEPFFEFEERDYRAVWLSNLVGIDTPMPSLDGPKPLPLLLVQGEREPYAVILEEVLDNRYLVVKRLGRYVPQVPGVIGGAILADGSVAGVVDVRELLRQRSDGASGPLQNIGEFSIAERKQDLPVVLVVDDSVSARRSLSELVTDAGYRSATAIDGLAALSSIEKEKPAAVLLDMEMPRMNGLELATHLRADADTSEIPLIMITSRSTEKHRRQAEFAGVDRYFTKPYQEDTLVDDLHQLIQ